MRDIAMLRLDGGIELITNNKISADCVIAISGTAVTVMRMRDGHMEVTGKFRIVSEPMTAKESEYYLAKYRLEPCES